jgi:phosphatidylglycerol:prolipoprotein diacylglycerol transferase
MMPILFSIGSVKFYSFGFFLALAVLAGGALLWYMVEKSQILKGREQVSIFDLLLYVVICGFIGARFGYMAVNYQTVSLFGFWQVLLKGGFILPIGLAVGILTLVWFLYKSNIRFFQFANLLTPSLFLGLTIGQIGAYLTEKGGNIPINLYILPAYFTIAIIVYFLLNRVKDGISFFIGLVGFGIVHLATGFWTGQKILLWHFTLYQIFAIALLFFSISAIMYLLIRGEKNA